MFNYAFYNNNNNKKSRGFKQSKIKNKLRTKVDIHWKASNSDVVIKKAVTC